MCVCIIGALWNKNPFNIEFIYTQSRALTPDMLDNFKQKNISRQQQATQLLDRSIKKFCHIDIVKKP